MQGAVNPLGVQANLPTGGSNSLGVQLNLLASPSGGTTHLF